MFRPDHSFTSSLFRHTVPITRDGVIAERLEHNMLAFGKSLKTLQVPVTPAAILTNEVVYCSNMTYLELELDKIMPFNTIVTREDLMRGQSISSYAIDFWEEEERDKKGHWKGHSSRTGRWQQFSRLSQNVLSSKKGNGQAQGVHGFSVGPKIIDFVPLTHARKVRFRCMSSMAKDGTAYLESFSLHKTTPQMIAGDVGVGASHMRRVHHHKKLK
jgi:hypothetical protein